MEARRTFDGARSGKQLWIILAAFLAAAVLGVGGAVAASDLTSAGKAPQIVKSYPAPCTVLRQDAGNGGSCAPQVQQSSSHHKQTVF